LKHSRKNLHRRREGGGDKFTWALKGVAKATGAYKKQKKIAEERAEYERLRQEAREIRKKFRPSRQTFSVRPSSNQFTLVPNTASAALTAPRQAFTALPGISEGELAKLSASRATSLRPLYVPEGMVAPRNDMSATIQRISNSTGQ
jgi:hypothetical protein